jgi:hypothetical protein
MTMARKISHILIIFEVFIAACVSKVHIVTAGYQGNFVFDPEVTYADVGDIVAFQFFPTNHSVVRGEYAGSQACGSIGCNPCVPYELIHTDKQGFHSENVVISSINTTVNIICADGKDRC